MSAESLCTTCGLCCDGTLFGYVDLATVEKEDAVAAGLGVVPVKNGVGFLQPCPQLDETRCCAIYSRRPSACRRYRCITLLAIEAGEIDLSVARTRVDSAHAAIAGLRRGLSLDAKVSAIRSDLAAAGNAGIPARLVALAALERVLDRHFRSPNRQVFKPDQAAITSSP